MNRDRIIRLFGFDSLLVLDEDTLYEIHRRIEEPRVFGRIAEEFRKPGKGMKAWDNWFGYIVFWSDHIKCEWKFISIGEKHLPSAILTNELKKYRFSIDERIYYRKLISRPSLGLSPPAVQGSTGFYDSAGPNLSVPCHHGLAHSAREFTNNLLVNT